MGSVRTGCGSHGTALHSAGAVLTGTLVVYGYMNDTIAAHVEAKKERRIEELQLPPLMGHFSREKASSCALCPDSR